MRAYHSHPSYATNIVLCKESALVVVKKKFKIIIRLKIKYGCSALKIFPLFPIGVEKSLVISWPYRLTYARTLFFLSKIWDQEPTRRKRKGVREVSNSPVASRHSLEFDDTRFSSLHLRHHVLVYSLHVSTCLFDFKDNF